MVRLLNPDSAESVAETRQSLLRSAYDALSARSSGLQNLPVFLGMCIENEVWASERTLESGRKVDPTSFKDFVHKPFPVGLGTTYEALEAVISGDPVLIDRWQSLTGRTVALNHALSSGSIVLPISKIRTDGGTQSRAGVDEGVVTEYLESLSALPPVVVFYDGTDHWLADGFHRLAAYTKAGKKTISAEVRQGDKRAAILYSVGANSTHGLRRTNADKRRAVELLLRDEEWSKKSDRWIAEQCGVSAMTVGRVRDELNCNIVTVVPDRQGQDGKTRKLPERKPPTQPADPSVGIVYPRTPEEPEDNCNVGPGPDDYDDEDIGPGVEPEDIDDEPQPKLVSTAVPPIVSSAILLVQRMTGPEVLTFVRRIQPLIAAAERGAKP